MLKYMNRYDILIVEKEVEMEQEKNNKGVIALLVVIIIILLALVILLATGTVSFKNTALIENQQSNSDEQT